MLSAFDLSLSSTGYVSERVDGVSRGTLRPPADLSEIERLDWIAKSVVRLSHGAELVIIEGFAFARPQQAHQLGGLGYIVRHSLWKLGIRYQDVAPATLKKFVTGKGNAKKDQMSMHVLKRFNVEPANDNEADAVGLFHIGLALLGQYEPTTDFQREVIQSIREGKVKKAKRAA